MNSSIKKLKWALVLVVVLMLPLLWIPNVFSEEWSTSERALTFIEDVMMLDIASYNVTVSESFENYSLDWGSLPIWDVRCVLESNESRLKVSLRFENYALVYCRMYIYEGSPFYTTAPSTDALVEADLFLQRHQNYTDSDRQEMRDILATVSEIENMTTTVDNVRFELSSEEERTRFKWVNTFNGADYTTFTFSFKDGQFEAMHDDYLVYQIGNTDLIFSEEEATAIARENAEGLTLKVQMGDETLTFTDIPILDEPVEAQLLTACREPLVLQPYWLITLHYDEVYPGNVFGVETAIWADTGEIFKCYAKSLMGSPIPEFPSWTPILLALVALAAFLAIYNRKLTKTQNQKNTPFPPF